MADIPLEKLYPEAEVINIWMGALDSYFKNPETVYERIQELDSDEQKTTVDNFLRTLNKCSQKQFEDMVKHTDLVKFIQQARDLGRDDLAIRVMSDLKQLNSEQLVEVTRNIDHSKLIEQACGLDQKDLASRIVSSLEILDPEVFADSTHNTDHAKLIAWTRDFSSKTSAIAFAEKLTSLSPERFVELTYNSDYAELAKQLTELQRGDLVKKLADNLISLSPEQFVLAMSNTNHAVLSAIIRTSDKSRAEGIVEKLANIPSEQYAKMHIQTNHVFNIEEARELGRDDLAILFAEKLAEYPPEQYGQIVELSLYTEKLIDVARDQGRDDLAEVFSAWDPNDHTKFLEAQSARQMRGLESLSLAKDIADLGR